MTRFYLTEDLVPQKLLRFIGIRMSRRLSFYGLVGLASVCIFFLAFNQRYSSYLEHRLQPVISVSKNSEVGIALKLSHAKHALSDDLTSEGLSFPEPSLTSLLMNSQANPVSQTRI